MDPVAKDGKMLMHFISEHVENAGVHSGDYHSHPSPSRFGSRDCTQNRGDYQEDWKCLQCHRSIQHLIHC
ncbi:hypothetical protein B9Z19DRAFT_1172846 [Tuber borchii]|uniref:Uncharacterized protein n=1 Tax=Tuber borchii TaxID=42251 RepID=A0A2T7A7W3_TUBBO|nr:hypothetical protein B9Z19DRAFT_1172846 [Tuber borchii]